MNFLGLQQYNVKKKMEYIKTRFGQIFNKSTPCQQIQEPLRLWPSGECRHRLRGGDRPASRVAGA